MKLRVKAAALSVAALSAAGTGVYLAGPASAGTNHALTILVQAPGCQDGRWNVNLKVMNTSDQNATITNIVPEAPAFVGQTVPAHGVAYVGLSVPSTGFAGEQATVRIDADWPDGPGSGFADIQTVSECPVA
jgi:hypothetical protein